MEIVSYNLHEMSRPVLWGEGVGDKKKYFNKSSGENFTQSAKR